MLLVESYLSHPTTPGMEYEGMANLMRSHYSSPAYQQTMLNLANSGKIVFRVSDYDRPSGTLHIVVLWADPESYESHIESPIYQESLSVLQSHGWTLRVEKQDL